MIIELIDLKKLPKKPGTMCNHNEFLKPRPYAVECDLKTLQ